MRKVLLTLGIAILMGGCAANTKHAKTPNLGNGDDVGNIENATPVGSDIYKKAIAILIKKIEGIENRLSKLEETKETSGTKDKKTNDISIKDINKVEIDDTIKSFVDSKKTPSN